MVAVAGRLVIRLRGLRGLVEADVALGVGLDVGLNLGLSLNLDCVLLAGGRLLLLGVGLGRGARLLGVCLGLCLWLCDGLGLGGSLLLGGLARAPSASPRCRRWVEAARAPLGGERQPERREQRECLDVGGARSW